MSIQVQGIRQAMKALEDYGQTVTEKLEDATHEAAINVERGAKKQLTSDGHVDTGRLRASIHPVFSGETDSGYTYNDKQGKAFDGSTNESAGDLESLVATNVEYAWPIETLDSFMFKSWEQERPKYIKRIKEVLGSFRTRNDIGLN